MHCPHCDHWFWSASAWHDGEPDFNPGVICPRCREFISEDDLDLEEETMPILQPPSAT